MEWVIVFVIVVIYCSLSSKLNKIINKQTLYTKKEFPSLKKLIGKTISIETNDESNLVFGSETKGILKQFNDEWIVIETINKKSKKEQYYYKLNNIVSIDIVEK